ncbi:LysR family transcriptional regulator [Pseudonocardia nigra]|uniref:LysR family transcriptional regulator n=1 Tax=Pseudonocardia nigra TaxID=1921578 RepID=UPI001C5D7667|nr:LysR substrate-binding domain-containing protein [Pseudonocardia nigra]
MHDFTLRQLEYFVAVVEEGSVTAAARRLHVSPGGVSLAISELESSLKVQLTLRRRAKGVTVTPAGRWAVEQARAVLEKSAELQEIARVVRGELVGPLRIGCFTTLSPWLLPRIIAHFTQQYPGVTVELSEGPSDGLQRRLHDGELDVVLMYSNHLAPGVDIEEIVPVRLQLVLPPTHRLAGLDEVPLREVQDEPAILLALQPAQGLVENILRAAGFEAKVRWRSTNVETIRSMVARGLGYTIIMGRPHGDRTYDGLPLAYKRIADEVPRNAVVVAYPTGTTPTAKVRTLIDFCRHEFAEEGQPVQ